MGEKEPKELFKNLVPGALAPEALAWLWPPSALCALCVLCGEKIKRHSVLNSPSE